MNTFRGKAAVTGRTIPAQGGWAGAKAPAADPVPTDDPGRVYTVEPRRDWNFTARLSATGNALRFTTDTCDHRLIISGASIVMLLVGLAGFLTGWSPAQIFGLGFYLLIGIGGAPWGLARRMRLPTRLAMTALTALCVPTIVGTLMLESGGWHPALAFTVLVLLTLPLHVYCSFVAVRDRTSLRPAGSGPGLPVRARARLARLARKHVSVSLVLALSGGALCFLAALTHRHIDPGLYGFLPVIGPFWYVGFALVLISFAVSRADSDASVAVAVLVLVLVLTGTPALVYDGARSQSASKHIDFVQQIRAFHAIDTSVAIYGAWPGYFAAMAWVCDVTGLKDPMRLAIWWPALIGCLKLAGLRFLAGTLLKSRTTAWVAVALAVLADPIGADYFSPQSVGFVIGLLAFAIALSHYDTALKVTALLGAGCTLAVSHQLSPYLVGGTLIILSVLRQVRPWWLPVTILGPAVVWATLHFSSLRGFLDISDVGNAKNFRPPGTSTAAGLERLPVVAISAYALAGGVLLIGAIAAVVVVRRWNSIEAWALAAAPAAGLVIIAVNPYGQEGIFRAALFGIPWLALLAAQLFREGGERRPNLPLVAVLTILSFTFLTASFGLDATNVIRPSDRVAFRYFQQHETAPGQSSYLLQLGPGDLPSSPPGQGRTHISVPLVDLEPGPGNPWDPPEAVARRLTSKILAKSGQSPAGAHIYALWSPTSMYYAWEYGTDRPKHFRQLKEALRTSPNWTVVLDTGGTVLFRYHPAAR